MNNVGHEVIPEGIEITCYSPKHKKLFRTTMRELLHTGLELIKGDFPTDEYYYPVAVGRAFGDSDFMFTMIQNRFQNAFRGPAEPLYQYAYPAWLDMNLWDEFVDMREKIDCPILSESGITYLLNRLKKLMDEGYAQKDIFGYSLSLTLANFYEPVGHSLFYKPVEIPDPDESNATQKGD